MKKIILIFISVLFIFLSIIGINYYINKENNSKNIEINNNIKENDDKVIEEVDNNDKYVDNNPIVVGLYKYYGKNKDRELIKEYSNTWNYHTDISSFEVFYTNDESISSNNQRELFDEYKNSYKDIDNYKIGYIINFQIKDKEINKTIISPKDTEDFYNYLEVYLYDDYHRNGEWYSHTTEKDYNNETILTSIKLTAGVNISEITSDITLTVFTYDEDDFNEKEQYIGNSYYKIVVKKQ